MRELRDKDWDREDQNQLRHVAILEVTRAGCETLTLAEGLGQKSVNWDSNRDSDQREGGNPPQLSCSASTRRYEFHEGAALRKTNR